MLGDVLQRNIKSEFSRNVVTLFSSTSIAQIIPFIVSPILTRLYAPEDFGLLALFVSVSSLISIIVTLQYEAAIVLPKEDSDAANLLGLCLIITCCITLVSLILVIFLNKTVSHWLNEENLGFWLYFVPIPVFLTGVYNTLNYWGIRKKQYKRLAFRTISQSVTTAGVKLLFGFIGALRSGLITGTIIGQTTATAVLAWFTWKDDKKSLTKISKNGIIKNSVIYNNFPKYTAWQGFFDMLCFSLISFFIASSYGSKSLGLYSFSFALLQRPIQLIGSSISQVYYQKASEVHKNHGNLFSITKKLVLRLFVIYVIIFLPVVLFGPTLFSLIFGDNWYQAGVYARIFIPWFLLKLLISPLGIIPLIYNKQRMFFIISLFNSLVIPCAFYLGINFNITITNNLIILSIVGTLTSVLNVIWITTFILRKNGF